MLVLGVSWLVLAPVCLWLLVRGRARVRVGALLVLVALQAATVGLDAAERAPTAPLALPAAPEPALSRPAASASARPLAPASPKPLAPAPSTPGDVVARPVTCASSPRAPEQARLITRGGELRAVALSWTAAVGECDTATVVLRRRGRTLRVWLHEGAAVRRAGARTLPVRVLGGTASTRVRLVPPLPGGADLVAVDGRTGLPITPG
ncbi:hypothetical protein GCM10010466_03750 [Planomonospora alba]|uniref:Uncharacterized protein n=1 Tax=Planomonospora alba TaxID=161354 RepID=A0ABP6MIT9_9ACTN